MQVETFDFNLKREYKCDYKNCDKSYNSKTHFLRHKKLKHEDNSNAHHLTECEICSKVMWSSNLARHTLRCHNDNRFKCPEDECLLTFQKRCLLVDHLSDYHLKNLHKYAS
ncbi:hypothetical protein A3Q56_01938, partial [Intoshia linei]